MTEQQQPFRGRRRPRPAPTRTSRAARIANRFDIRRIIGGLFLLYGVILVVVGIVGSDEVKNKAAGINVNLWTGLAMLVVGALMVSWALARPVVPEPEATGARDRGIGARPQLKRVVRAAAPAERGAPAVPRAAAPRIASAEAWATRRRRSGTTPAHPPKRRVPPWPLMRVRPAPVPRQAKSRSAGSGKSAGAAKPSSSSAKSQSAQGVVGRQARGRAPGRPRARIARAPRGRGARRSRAPRARRTAAAPMARSAP